MHENNIETISKTLASLPPHRRALFAKHIEGEYRRWQKFKRLDATREMLHISVTRLTDSMNMAQPRYSKYRSGVYVPTLKTIGYLRQTLRLFGQYEVSLFAEELLESCESATVPRRRVYLLFRGWVEQYEIRDIDIKQMTEARFDYLLRQDDDEIKRVRGDKEYHYSGIKLRGEMKCK
jgi:transcriptional regulator with XRE-family HTH domain